jgi:hypothetical protein
MTSETDGSMLGERLACRATAHAMRPTARAQLARSRGFGSAARADQIERIESVLAEAMGTDSLLGRTAAWWSASGRPLTAALVHVTDLEEGQASYFVGAAVHAQIVSGGDLVQDAVLRLAERAASWHHGYLTALSMDAESVSGVPPRDG